jgi:hypothetical protein
LSIAEIQYDLASKLASKRLLREGIAPTMGEVSYRIGQIIGEGMMNQPTVRIKHQSNDDRVDLKALNDFLSSAGFDLLVLQREITKQSADFLSNSIKQEIDFELLNHEADQLERIAQSILNTADPQIKPLTVGFEDTENINLPEGTAYHDIAARETTLLPAAGHQRLSLAHLRDIKNPNLKVVDIPPARMFRNSFIQGSGFHNCLFGTDNVWLHEIAIKDWNRPTTFELDVSITSQEFEWVSQVSMTPVTSVPIDISVARVVSGRTVSALDNSQRTKGRRLNFVSRAEKAKKIRITFKLEPAETRDGISYFRFGLSSLDVFRGSYQLEGTTVIGPLVTDPIKSIQFDTEERVRASTSIDYQVRFSNDYQETAWMDLEPESRRDRRLSYELKLQDAMEFEGDLDLLNFVPERITRVNGIDFYTVGNIDSNHFVNKSSARLFRGINAWVLDSGKERLRGNASIQINFRYQTNDNSQPLYIYKTEQAEIASGIRTGTDDDGNPVIVGDPILRVRQPIDFNPASNQLIPRNTYELGLTEVDTSMMNQYEPTFSIAYVRKESQEDPIERTQGTIKRSQTNAQDEVSGQLNETASAMLFYLDPASSADLLNLPVVYPYPIFIRGVARTIDGTEHEISGFVKVVDPQTIIENQESKTVLAIDSESGYGLTLNGFEEIELQSWSVGVHDLTPFIADIDARWIKFAEGIYFDSNDKISVHYRAKLNSNLKLVPGTLKVTSGAQGIEYEEGKDFAVDPENGRIFCSDNSRIATTNKSKCYCAFEWEETFSETYRISSNFLVDNNEGVEIALKRFGGRISSTEQNQEADYDTHDIEPDPSRGEFVSISANEKNYILVKDTTITLGPGWHRIVIQATNLRRLRDFLTAVDENNVYLFTKNAWFSEQIADLNPLLFAEPDVLYESSLLGKSRLFSIDDESRIVIPFDPKSNALINNEIYNIYKGEMLDIDLSRGAIAKPGEFPVISEQFKLRYSYLPLVPGYESETEIPEEYTDEGRAPLLKRQNVYDRIELKAVLRREVGAHTELTPALRSITLKVES